MPGQGVTSTFTFGEGFGKLQMALCAAKIPYQFITPLKWQKFLGCMTKGDKNVSKAAAQRLFPDIKVTHAIADALLIAEYNRRTYI
jgi:crossover junction endodeoxyribonuclease RuvC